ncbi:hypothetical protein NLJ89_g63 [Agrocybe chaxingu]|uniref:Helicase ATP-binding domain-containing protein n=1 Tax=Agrocybe chaxingu TaxID=84603 RepID=A0A9W8N2Q9_9AGAR|nr:hypothetical protein NLJ89_g63 [Agrocybe chaxingu]
MPAFQLPFSKRKREDEDLQDSQKRIALEPGTSYASQKPSGKYSLGQTWIVQWRNPQYKKHKTWDGDATMVVDDKNTATLYDADGKVIAMGKVSPPLFEGKNMSVAGKEIELERPLPPELFLSGACFAQSLWAPSGEMGHTKTVKKFTPPSFTASPRQPSMRHHDSLPASSVEYVAPREEYGSNGKQSSPRRLSDVTNVLCHWTANWRKPQDRKNKTWDGDAYVSLVKDRLVMMSEDGKVMGSITWKGQQLCTGFHLMIGGKEVELDVPVSADQLPTNVEEGSTTGEQPATPSDAKPAQKFIAPTNFYGVPKPKAKGPLHDPDAEDALVMKSPTKEHIKRFNKRWTRIIYFIRNDPKTHSTPGVRFLYECAMGLRKHEGQGCILADEMGLGKTLQTIALVWTLLRQNPYAAPLPVVQKVLIVCPVSLVNNWKAEFYKWLGRDRVGIMTCDKNNSSVDTFGRSKVYEVLIIGYERLRTAIDKLIDLHPPIGLVICDEGHRLKSANNKTASVFKAFATRRRIILSGTPIQNDLGEFHAMSEFCNPGLLAEYVLFVRPTGLQLSMFSRILHPAHLDDLIQSSTAESLALINILTKISNSPILLKATADNIQSKINDGGTQSFQKKAVLDASRLLPNNVNVADVNLSGKLSLLSKILRFLRQHTGEKCVIVSHFTSTLNILEAYCKTKSYSYYRLDGQTPQNKRQEHVNAFNKGNQQNSFVFLLSSKAGGVGINLIEKIYQRQVTKLALSDSLIGSGNSGSSKSDSFTRKDLRDIFRIYPDTACNTHDLLGCDCEMETSSSIIPEVALANKHEQVLQPVQRGFIAASAVSDKELDAAERDYLQKKRADLAALGEWSHINCLKPFSCDRIQDDVLRKAITPKSEEMSDQDFQSSIRDLPGGTISFLFEKCSCSQSNMDNIEEQGGTNKYKDSSSI